MTISAHITEFFGLPVVEFHPERQYDVMADKVAWRIPPSTDAPIHGVPRNEAPVTTASTPGQAIGGPPILGQPGIDALVARFGAGSITALVIDEPNLTKPNLINPASEPAPASGPDPVDGPEPADGPAHRLASLRALYLNGAGPADNGTPHDITPLVNALPGLEELHVHGQFTLDPVRHGALRVLTLDSGGQPAAAVRAIGESSFPRLEHLDLWLGTAAPAGPATQAAPATPASPATVDDLGPVLSGSRLPALRSLGLRGAEIADQVAAAIAGASVVAQLTDLDLSMGGLSDVGAEALLAGQPLIHLHTLRVAGHVLSGDMAARLLAELPTTQVDLSEPAQAADKRPEARSFQA